MMPHLTPSRTPRVRDPLRVLVADDNEVLRAAVAGLIRILGHSVTVVSNGRQAVEAAARAAFDLVILDVQMPEMDGITAAHALRQGQEGRHSTRIIGISGESVERGLAEGAGMHDFLLKPVRLADLVLALDRLFPP